MLPSSVAAFIAWAAEEEFNPDDVTPGVWGFAITFAVILVAVLLVLDMVRRVRRTNYRAEIGKRLDAEAATREAEQADPPKDV